MKDIKKKMMKLNKLISFFLAISLLFKIGMVLSIQINYFINKKEIAEKYCENKEKPKLQCNGKCHLKKQLEKIEPKETKNDKKQHSTSSLKAEDLFFSSENTTYISYFTQNKRSQHLFYYVNLYRFYFNFHPKSPPQYLV